MSRINRKNFKKVYVLIEDSVDLTNKIFLNNNGIEEDEDLKEL